MVRVKKDINVELKLILDEFNKNIRSADREILALNKSLKLGQAEFQNTGDKVTFYEGKLNTLQTIQEKTGEKIKMTEEALESARNSLGENSETAYQLANQLTNLKIKFEQNKTSIKDVEKELSNAKNGMLKFGQQASETGKKLESIGKSIEKVGKQLMIVSGLVTALGIAVVNSAISFESSFAGVEKTFPGTATELQKLKQEIVDMSLDIPATTLELNRVAEAAGQLGIKSESISEFTRTMIDLGVSTNMTSEDAATMLARFANITQMDQSNFDRLASTVVALGNNFATTEGEIVEMSLRLAAAGKQCGLNENQIMALSATLSSLGLESQAGGTAFSKLMLSMKTSVETGSADLKQFADAAGMSVEQFSKAFEEDATKALAAFLEGIANTEERGRTATVILEEMGISEIRLRDAILRTSGATELLTGALDLGNEAWVENNALSKEAEKRYATTESKIQIMKNTASDLARSFGELLLPKIQEILDKLQNFIKWLNGSSDSTKNLIIQIGLFLAALGPITLIVGKTISMIGGLTTFIGGLSAKIALAGGLVPFLSGGLATLGTIIGVLFSPIGLIIAAIGAFIAAMIYLWNTNEDVKNNLILIWDTLCARLEPIISFITMQIDNFIVFFKSSIGVVLGVLEGLIQFVAGVFSGDWGMAWEGIQTIFKNIVIGIVSFFEMMVNNFIGGLNWLIEGVNMIPGIDIQQLQKVTWSSDLRDSWGMLSNNIVIEVNGTVREEADIDKIASQVNNKLGGMVYVD